MFTANFSNISAIISVGNWINQRFILYCHFTLINIFFLAFLMSICFLLLHFLGQNLPNVVRFHNVWTIKYAIIYRLEFVLNIQIFISNILMYKIMLYCLVRPILYNSLRFKRRGLQLRVIEKFLILRKIKTLFESWLMWKRIKTHFLIIDSGGNKNIESSFRVKIKHFLYKSVVNNLTRLQTIMLSWLVNQNHNII